MRTMYDGIDSDASVIPTSAQLVAGYVDGNYAWSAADWARFPHSVHVPIAVHPTTNAGIVLDCEPGNCSPAQAVDWVVMRRKAGADPTVYCNQENPSTGLPAVRAAFKARGVAEPHYWVANYDGNTAIPAGTIAKQYESTSRWDLSSVADYWPGVDPAPTKEPDMEWTDTVSSPGGRPHGNEVQYILADLGGLRDRLAGDKTIPVPAGSPLAQLLAFLAGSAQLPATVAQIEKQVSALAQPSVDATALAAALAGNSAFVSAIAAAVVAQIGTELKPTV